MSEIIRGAAFLLLLLLTCVRPVEAQTIEDACVQAAGIAKQWADNRDKGVSKDVATIAVVRVMQEPIEHVAVLLTVKALDMVYAEPVQPPKRVAADFYRWCLRTFNPQVEAR